MIHETICGNLVDIGLYVPALGALNRNSYFREYINKL